MEATVAPPRVADEQPGPEAVSLREAVRGALPLWLASRLAFLWAGAAALWVVLGPATRDVLSWGEAWNRWDVAVFTWLAEDGYPDRGEPRNEAVAFLPAMPLTIRLVHLVVPSWVAAAMVVSAVAGAFGAVALWRMAAEESGPRAARLAVAYLVLFPSAVYLVSGYSEALFIGLAFPAWWAARHGRWLLATALVSVAVWTRIIGFLLAIAMGVEYLTWRWRATAGLGLPWPRRLVDRSLAWFALPIASYGGLLVWFHAKTGHVDGYTRALEKWDRHVVNPVTAWRNTWGYAMAQSQPADWAWSFRFELLVIVGGILLTLVLLSERRLGEATYVALTVAVLSTSSWYDSGRRVALTWFPLFLLLGRLGARSPRWNVAVLWVFVPLAFVTTAGFVAGSWV